jgi:ketosteroid isomerase-like protein
MHSNPANDEAAVIRTLHDACKAYQDGDIDAIRRHLTDDFILTDADGVITSREDDVRLLQTNAMDYTLFENRDMKVRLHGDSAVVSGITEVRGNAGSKTFAAKFQFTDTVVREGGRWRVAASHISRLAN